MGWHTLRVSSSLKIEEHRGKHKCLCNLTCLITVQGKQSHILPRHLPTKACTRPLLTCEEQEDTGLRKVGITLTCCRHGGGPINGGLLLPAHRTPLCHPTGTPCDHHPSKGKKPSCDLFPSESSSASQSGLHGRYKLELCSQRDLDTQHQTLPLELKDTLRGFVSEGTNHFNFCFPVAITVILLIVLVWDLLLPPTLGFSEAGWFSYFLIIWYFGLLYLPFWYPHCHQLFFFLS